MTIRHRDTEAQRKKSFFHFRILCASVPLWRFPEHHHRTGESNGDAHLKNLLLHHQVLLPVTEGKLDLGPWQQVYYAEFDGQRRKRVILKIIGE